jgi:predicted RNase H-like nuclease (RuvC/YqgF family)
VTRTIRERPRFAALLGLGVACLVGAGLLAGVLLGGGESSGAEDRDRLARVEARLARELRAAEAELAAARGEIERLERRGDRLEARAESWRRRAQRLERRNRALRQASAP